LHQCDALKTRTDGEDKSRRRKTIHILVRQHEQHARDARCRLRVDASDAALSDRCRHENREPEFPPAAIGPEARFARYLSARADALNVGTN
jgi:hypothetical protein